MTDFHERGKTTFIPGSLGSGEEIVGRAIAKITEDKSHSGSYFDLIPPDIRNVILQMVNDNFSFYSDRFSKESFREAVAENWLVKREAFDTLAEATGFRQIPAVNAPNGPIDPNKAMYAFLTRSSSYAFVGPGAFNPNGPGAAFLYDCIPLRIGEQLKRRSHKSGVYFLEQPSVGEKAKTTVLTLSRVTSLWVKDAPADPAAETQVLEDTVAQAFRTVDAQTIG
jgi:hypothetical protein